MSLARKLLTVTAPIALLALGACATPFQADVARFQAMPAPQGQSFIVQPADSRMGGLEFSQYSALVAQRLAQQGYTQAPDARSATLLVTLDYGVDRGVEKVYTRPGSGFGYGSGFGGPWGWGPYWGGYRSRFYYGWNDPFWGNGWDYPEVSSYTLFTSHLDMQIKRTVDSQPLFEGHAKARSRDDNLTYLVPNLVEAMFTSFPGRSGETVKITVPPPPRQ